MVADRETENQAVDQAVGRNVRLRRRQLGLSQTQVAGHLGMTFQQVQKYERGVNRMAASTLWRIAGVLDCTVADLFEGVPPPASPGAKVAAGTPHSVMGTLLTAPGGLVLAEAFLSLDDDRRRALVAAGRALARGTA